MNKYKVTLKSSIFIGIAALCVLGIFHFEAEASDPYTAYYSADNNRIFWFVHITDIHIGARGSQDSDYLSWIVNDARSIINPEFIVATGDLTDSTNGNLFGLPNGPHQAEWDEYQSILSAANMDATIFYDIPGNHDAYSDQYFTYYLANSIQGQAIGQTQISWSRNFSFGKYHFLGVNSCDNTGAPFSLSWPWGDYAGLDQDELDYIDAQLFQHSDAELTILFGHHPVTDTGYSDDTWLYYGSPEFVGYMDTYGTSVYRYGHTHRLDEQIFAGDPYTGFMTGGGINYICIPSLGKSSNWHYSVVAVDCNGISSTTQDINTWPVVLITTPVDRYVGGSSNPFAYSVPNSSSNPIRALVFDSNTVTQVQYRIDGAGDWLPMSQVIENPKLWEALWDASALPGGEHTIEVQATGSAVRSHTITIHVTASNSPPVADDQTVNTNENTAVNITLTASDADGDPLTYQVVSQPLHGALDGVAPDLTYNPDPGYVGADSFTFKSNDGQVDSNIATVSLTVIPSVDIVTILAASYNPKPKRLTVEATSTAQPDAVLTVIGYGIMTYSAADGRYIFNKKISPPPGDYIIVESDRGGSDTYYFNGGSNNPPVAHDQTLTTAEDTPIQITLTANDAENDPLTFTVLTQPSNGNLTGTAPDLTYTPDTGYTGSDSFTFKANDGQEDSNSATISITVGSAGQDTVTILVAEYKAKAKRLLVEATSSMQPNAVLTVDGYGEMTYSAAESRYVFQAKVTQAPGSTVTVISSQGGSDSQTVTIK